MKKNKFLIYILTAILSLNMLGPVLAEEVGDGLGNNMDAGLPPAASETAALTTSSDIKAPTMSVTVNENVVTVAAADETGLHAQAYSFNGGTTWQESNTYQAAWNQVFAISGIQVRDAAGNIEYNRSAVNVPDKPQDKTPPKITSITVKGNTITVAATDETGLHAQAYSFDGGITWQTSASYTVTGSKTYIPGVIQVRDTAGNIDYNRTSVTAPIPDKTPPKITKITVKGNTVTVAATDETGLHAQAYSFDGGITWQTSASYTVTGSKTYIPGVIQVRDTAGNIDYNRTSVNVPDKPQDKTPPKITSITVKGNTITVAATDETGLHAQAYSFDGGITWQTSASYTVTGSKTYIPGVIQVRDTAGNIDYNRTSVTAPIPDKTPPKITSITVKGNTITVAATDETGLHAQAYSFDGGVTWQTSASYTVTGSKTYIPGVIQVRDTAGNIDYNRTSVTAPIPDKTPPKITSITVKGNTVTVVATDETGLHAQAYSFDGGVTWQASNSYTLTQSKTYIPGVIQVRDTAGNIDYNRTSVTVVVDFAWGSKMIDVSAHQGVIDWAQVKASGIEYAIIRALSQSGNPNEPADIVDAYFMQNVRAAKANGIKVGAYIYTYAFNEAEVDKEIALFNGAAKQLATEGYTFDLPVFIDQEYQKMLNATTKDQRTSLLRRAMQLLDQNGYYPGMYMSTLWAQNNVDAAQLQREGYDLWIADYRSYNGYGDSVVAWQYSSQGSVPGIYGNVDMNYLYKDYSQLIHGSNNSGVTPPAAKYTVYDQNTKTNVTDTMDNLIAAIVNNEVGSGCGLTSGDRPPLYKAQAVATRSWLLYHLEEQGTLPSVGLKYDGNFVTVKNAIAGVIGYRVTYNGKTANTVYGASSAATTNSAQDYWGNIVPYLVPVVSPYEGIYNSNLYNPKVWARTSEQVKADIAKLGITATGDASTWITVTARNAAGYVTGVQVCGQSVPIAKFYETVNGPYSPNFTFSYANNTFTFTAYGFGHCVGMSQWGAAGYIGSAGMSWQQVLAHYYPGTALELR